MITASTSTVAAGARARHRLCGRRARASARERGGHDKNVRENCASAAMSRRPGREAGRQGDASRWDRIAASARDPTCSCRQTRRRDAPVSALARAPAPRLPRGEECHRCGLRMQGAPLERGQRPCRQRRSNARTWSTGRCTLRALASKRRCAISSEEPFGTLAKRVRYRRRHARMPRTE